MLQGKAKNSSSLSPPTTRSPPPALHPPSKEEVAGPKADNGDPYYCLQDLAAHWPDPDPAKVRAVLVFTRRDRALQQLRAGYASQVNPTVDIAVAEPAPRRHPPPFALYYSTAPASPLPGQIARKGCTDCLDQARHRHQRPGALPSQAEQPHCPAPHPSPAALPLLTPISVYTEAVATVTAKGSWPEVARHVSTRRRSQDRHGPGKRRGSSGALP